MSFTYLAELGGVLGGMLNGNIPVGAVEIEEYCRKVLMRRQLDGLLPIFPVWDDVTTFRIDNQTCKGFIEYLRSISDELRICGGFPCQDISSSGKQKGLDGERSGLWFEFARIIDEMRPAQVLLENSPCIVVLGLERVLASLASMGYDARWGNISARDMGAGTIRERWWLLGNRQGVMSVDGLQDGLYQEIKIRLGSCCAAFEDGEEAWLMADALAVRTLDGVSGWMERFRSVGNAQFPKVASVAELILGN